MAAGPTPSQTVGPFFHIAFPADGDEIVTTEQTEGERIRIEGRLFDGEGAAVTDAFVEIWQANAHGRYAHPQDRQDKPQDGDFGGYGRCATDDAGGFRFETIRPGRVPGRGNAFQAPHINVSVFARGLLDRLVTRLYFDDEAEANAEDPVLQGLADEASRRTLIAARVDAGGATVFRLDIHLQGSDEAVFFDV